MALSVDDSTRSEAAQIKVEVVGSNQVVHLSQKKRASRSWHVSQRSILIGSGALLTAPTSQRNQATTGSDQARQTGTHDRARNRRRECLANIAAVEPTRGQLSVANKVHDPARPSRDAASRRYGPPD